MEGTMGGLMGFIGIMCVVLVGLLLIAYGIHCRRVKRKVEYTDPKIDRHYHYNHAKMERKGGEGFHGRLAKSRSHHRRSSHDNPSSKSVEF